MLICFRFLFHGNHVWFIERFILLCFVIQLHQKVKIVVCVDKNRFTFHTISSLSFIKWNFKKIIASCESRNFVSQTYPFRSKDKDVKYAMHKCQNKKHVISNRYAILKENKFKKLLFVFHRSSSKDTNLLRWSFFSVT